MKTHVWGSGASLVVVTLAASVALLGLMLSLFWLASRVLGFELAERITALFCGSKKTLASGVPMARLILVPRRASG